MAKVKLTLSVEQETKAYAEKVGKWYLAQGVDVEDKLKGGVSISATIRQLIADKLTEIEGHDPDQAYFWTEAWQAAERQVDAELAAGRYKDFATMEEFLADLDSDDDE